MNGPLPPEKNVRRKKPISDIPPVAPSIPPPTVKTESRFMRVFRGVVGVTMVIAIGGTVAWGARKYVKSSPRFAVNDVVTTGAKRRSADELMATAGIAKGQNVFAVDLDRAKTKLLADPWIESADLSRQLPGTIFVQVKERQAAGLVSVGNETYLATREGAIIKRLEPGDPTDLHVVTGIGVQQLVDDRDGATRSIKRALDLAFDYDRSQLAVRAPVEEVHVEPSGDMTLVVGKNGVMLHMGTAPYRRKLEQAVRVVAELDRRGAKADAIHLDSESRPDRVVVRMR
jgi:cell division protein FtsQ